MTRSKYEEMGREAGHAAATWFEVEDADHARRILKGYDDGDPEIMDMQPSPLSGEWAGESIMELFGRTPSGDQLDRYENAYSEAYWAEIVRVCNYHAGQ